MAATLGKARPRSENNAWLMDLLSRAGTPEGLGTVAKGRAVSAFTYPPDVIGMLSTLRAEPKQPDFRVPFTGGPGQGAGFAPHLNTSGEPVMSGDPLRNSIGLDPNDLLGQLGELFDPYSALAKAAKAAAVIPGFILGKAKKASHIAEDVTQTVTKLKAPPINQSGEVELIHYSNQKGLKELDPDKFGTGAAGAEKRRREAYPEEWVNRTYFGVEPGKPGGYRKESMLGNEKYRVFVPADKLYDLTEDSLGLFKNLSEDVPAGARVSVVEKQLKERGYSGYWTDNGSGGMSAAVFEKTIPRPEPQILNRAAFLYDDTIPAAAPPGTRLKVDIGKDFQEEALAVWGGKAMDETAENLEIVTSNMLDEAMGQLSLRPEMAGWYKANLSEAMTHASRIFPELATDKEAQSAFKIILAVTSNGQKVPLNSRLTRDYYKIYRDTGEFAIVGSGTSTNAMKQSFNTANKMVKELGWDDFDKFLDREFTVRDLLEATGIRVSGENLDTVVNGSAVFGPKIGGGFLQNLRGNYDPPTFDLWWQRTWGRHTGTLMVKPELAAAQRESLRLAIGKKRKIMTKAGFDPDKVLNDTAEFDRFSEYLYTELKKGGFDDKSPINNAARNLHKSIGDVVNAPSGGSQRQYMRKAMLNLRDKMRAQGIVIDTADVQALMWYVEKDLTKKMGGTSTALTDDYASSWRKLADEFLVTP